MKRLLASLLPSVIPSDAREHVMGDLAERHFRLRDIASVLPRVWLSSVLRLYTSPTPSFIGATEETFEHRIREFQRDSSRQRDRQFILLSLLSYPILGTPAFLFLCLLLWGAFFIIRNRFRRTAGSHLASKDLPLSPRLLDSYLGPRTWREYYVRRLGPLEWIGSTDFLNLLAIHLGLVAWFWRDSITASFLVRQCCFLACTFLLSLPWVLRVRRERRALRDAASSLSQPALRFPSGWATLFSGLRGLYFLLLLIHWLRVFPLPPYGPLRVAAVLLVAGLFVGFFVAPTVLEIRDGLRTLTTARDQETAKWKA